MSSTGATGAQKAKGEKGSKSGPRKVTFCEKVERVMKGKGKMKRSSPELGITIAVFSQRPINFGSRSSRNCTLQKSLAVKSSDHSWLLRRYFRFSGVVFATRYRRITKQFLTGAHRENREPKTLFPLFPPVQKTLFVGFQRVTTDLLRLPRATPCRAFAPMNVGNKTGCKHRRNGQPNRPRPRFPSDSGKRMKCRPHRHGGWRSGFGIRKTFCLL